MILQTHGNLSVFQLAGHQEPFAILWSFKKRAPALFLQERWAQISVFIGHYSDVILNALNKPYS